MRHIQTHLTLGPRGGLSPWRVNCCSPGDYAPPPTPTEQQRRAPCAELPGGQWDYRLLATFANRPLMLPISLLCLQMELLTSYLFLQNQCFSPQSNSDSFPSQDQEDPSSRVHLVSEQRLLASLQQVLRPLPTLQQFPSICTSAVPGKQCGTSRDTFQVCTLTQARGLSLHNLMTGGCCLSIKTYPKPGCHPRERKGFSKQKSVH